MERTVGMEPITIGVIGVGQMGSAHALNMAQLDEVRVVAVADVDAERARVIGDAIGAPRGCRGGPDCHPSCAPGTPRR